jgi:hypothetical protein
VGRKGIHATMQMVGKMLMLNSAARERWKPTKSTIAASRSASVRTGTNAS